MLLLRRVGGNPRYERLYELPGGKLDFGEDPKASLLREVTEETGLEVTTLQLFDVYSTFDIDEQRQYISLVFWAGVKAGERITLSGEHDKYTWQKMSEIQLNDVTEFTRIELQLEPLLAKTDEAAVDANDNAAKITTNIERVIIYSDGGSRGNPGPSASGFVIKDMSDHTLFEGGKYLGVTTNNQAEYQAVKLALEKAIEMGVRYVQFRMDSLLVVNQLSGVYQIKNRDLWPIHAAIKELMAKFKEISFTHVLREYNKEADAMVNKILDAQA